MNSKHNTRISILIGIFTLTIICTIVSYMLSGRDKSVGETTYDIAFLSDTEATRNDDWNEACISVVRTTADKLKKRHHTYHLDSKAKRPYEDIMSTAISNNCKLVICPDRAFAEAVYKVQNTSHQTYFLLIDSLPHNADSSDFTKNFNVIPIQFDEAEIGFIAGYALVTEGYSDLLVVGSENDSSSLHYLYGFLQGADLAALEHNCPQTKVRIINPKDSSQLTDALEHAYTGKSKVLISTCDAYMEHILPFAHKYSLPVVTCGNHYLDISKEDAVIAASSKNISNALSQVITDFYSSTLSKDTPAIFSTVNQGILFRYDTDRFTNFSKKDLDDLYRHLSDGSIQIIGDITVPLKELGLKCIKIK